MRVKKVAAAVESVDTSGLTSLDLVDTAICTHNEEYVRRCELLDKVKQAKKDIADSYKEQIKDLQEKVNAEMGIISALKSHRSLINAAENMDDDSAEEVMDIVNSANNQSFVPVAE